MSFIPKTLSPTVSVSPQIASNDIDAIVAAGVKIVVCHRPDEELNPAFAEAEPTHSDLEDLLGQHDIRLIYQPIQHVSEPELQRFADILADHADAPLLAYCTTGTRSCLLWALVQVHVHQQPRESVLATAECAGYAIAPYLT